MSKFDYLDLNGRTLLLFLTVYEEKSVTKAAERLKVGQSAVSHSLDKLRAITGDPLFVRAGRGIIATKGAEQFAEQVRPLLAALKNLTEPTEFDPFNFDGEVTIGADAYQRELLLPHFARVLRKEAPMLDLKVVNSGISNADALRRGRSDLLITPDPPVGTEFIQQKLFEDHWVCFFDASTSPPETLDQYLARRHAKIVFSDNEQSLLDIKLEEMGQKRRVALRVASFSALSSLMSGTDLVVALPQLIKTTFLQEFAFCQLPIDLPPLTFFMTWHLGTNLSPTHKWLRRTLKNVVRDLKL